VINKLKLLSKDIKFLSSRLSKTGNGKTAPNNGEPGVNITITIFGEFDQMSA
jgi:hypothetical protein